MEIVIGKTYKYINHRGERVIARAINPKVVNGVLYAKIDGTVNGEHLTTISIPIRQIERAFRRSSCH